MVCGPVSPPSLETYHCFAASAAAAAFAATCAKAAQAVNTANKLQYNQSASASTLSSTSASHTLPRLSCPRHFTIFSSRFHLSPPSPSPFCLASATVSPGTMWEAVSHLCRLEPCRFLQPPSHLFRLRLQNRATGRVHQTHERTVLEFHGLKHSRPWND